MYEKMSDTPYFRTEPEDARHEITPGHDSPSPSEIEWLRNHLEQADLPVDQSDSPCFYEEEFCPDDFRNCNLNCPDYETCLLVYEEDPGHMDKLD